MLALGKF